MLCAYPSRLCSQLGPMTCREGVAGAEANNNVEHGDAFLEAGVDTTFGWAWLPSWANFFGDLLSQLQSTPSWRDHTMRLEIHHHLVAMLAADQELTAAEAAELQEVLEAFYTLNGLLISSKVHIVLQSPSVAIGSTCLELSPCLPTGLLAVKQPAAGRATLCALQRCWGLPFRAVRATLAVTQLQFKVAVGSLLPGLGQALWMGIARPELRGAAGFEASLDAATAYGYLAYARFKAVAKEDKALAVRCLKVCKRWAAKHACGRPAQDWFFKPQPGPNSQPAPHWPVRLQHMVAMLPFLQRALRVENFELV